MINILNLGCGKNPFTNTKDIQYLNMDMIKAPLILKHNITKFPYPLQPEFFDRVYLFHTIEHIPEPLHRILLLEIRRVLKPEGQFVVSYPEFIKVAQNYIDNKAGKRDFWKKVIYGRGLTEWDRHKALMNTEDFCQLLREVGLPAVQVSPEKSQSFNTVIVAKKGEPMISYEALLGKEFALGTEGG